MDHVSVACGIKYLRQ